jgi:hypothetical protein
MKHMQSITEEIGIIKQVVQIGDAWKKTIKTLPGVRIGPRVMLRVCLIAHTHEHGNTKYPKLSCTDQLEHFKNTQTKYLEIGDAFLHFVRKGAPTPKDIQHFRNARRQIAARNGSKNANFWREREKNETRRENSEKRS